MLKMNKPLAGLCVLNTRPLAQSEELNTSLKTLGAQVVLCPGLKTCPIATSWEKHAPLPQAFDIIIFISVNAVTYYFERRSKLSWPASIPTFALGQATAAALLTHQIVSLQPEDSRTEGLLSLEPLQKIRGKKILIVKGTDGRTLLQTELINRGAFVETLDVYTRTMPEVEPKLIQQIWRENRIDIILFTSQQSMQHIFTLFGSSAQTWLQSKPSLVISQRLADIARQMGMKKIFITAPNQIQEGLINVYAELKREKQGTSYD